MAALPGGMPDGKYPLGEMKVEKRDGAVRLARKDTLAGSALTMDQAVRNMVAMKVPLEDAVMMASGTPARAAGLTDRGSIEVGSRADFVILDAKDHSVRETIASGVTRFDGKARQK